MNSTLLRLRTIVALAVLFLPLPIGIMQYVGEESIYAIKTYEMFHSGQLGITTLYGREWPHGVLFHWLAIPLAELLGWSHLDIAIRSISVMASMLSAAVAAGMARWLFPQHAHAPWLAAAIYLSMGEVAFWYGWLGHVDALFAMFIFAAIAALWRALAERRLGWWLVALISIDLAFLTKNITAFAFFGLAGLVLMKRLHRFDILRSWPFLLAGAVALFVPFAFQHLTQTAASTGSISQTLLWDIPRALVGGGWQGLIKHVVGQPVVLLFRALPISLFLLYLWLRERPHWRLGETEKTLAWIIFVCFVPVWFPSGTSPRYLVPLYGLVALLLTALLLQLERARLRQAMTLMLVVVMVKLPYSLFILPALKDWRPGNDIKAVAHEVLDQIGDAPLYTRNQVPDGYSIAAYIDVWRLREPVLWYRGQRGVYVLAQQPSRFGRLVRSWRLRGDVVYLYHVPR